MSFHKPKVFRSTAGCCICKAKSSRWVCVLPLLWTISCSCFGKKTDPYFWGYYGILVCKTLHFWFISLFSCFHLYIFTVKLLIPLLWILNCYCFIFDIFFIIIYSYQGKKMLHSLILEEGSHIKKCTHSLSTIIII